MGLIPNQRHQLAVVELDRRAPQTAHFQQLVQERGEGSYEPEQQPRRGADFDVGLADRPADGFGHFNSRLDPLPAKVKHIERRQCLLDFGQPNDSFREIGPHLLRGRR